MESSWRLDVWALGMHQSDWELVAWLNVPWVAGELIVRREGNPNAEIWLYLGPGQLPEFYFDFGPVPGFPHFPFGFPVSGN